MKSKKEPDIIPYYSTLPMLQPQAKSKEGRVTIPSDEDVLKTKRWSEELKL